MKKIYIQPTTEIYETQASSLMAGSPKITEDAHVDMSGESKEAYADDACSRGGNFFDDVFQVLLLFIMMTATLCVHAQNATTVEPADAPEDGKKHAMTIYFSNETQVSYSLEDLEHVTYLPGIGMKVYLKNATTSVDYLFSQMTKIVYVMDVNNANANAKAFSMTDFPEAYRLEYPHLNNNVSATGTVDNCQVIVKRTQDYGITYSLEWDNAKIANRWTCYELHAGNSMSTTDRNDDFKADPEVAVSSTLNDYKGSGFSRGHLCPSADRLCSVEQNKQTFFLTNMQPQYQSHNGGLWSRLETEVRDYATNDSKTQSHCDTLYIVKAATITDKVTINDTEVDGVYAERCNGRLLVPKYFYMALLHYNKETDTYQALAFWTDHIDTNQSVAYLGDYAITIDELERRTGIDFFCNLPDEIEDAVEATINLDFWHLTTTP
ncbi:MAG: DNA/RNA non-specific endonuclease [Prevotella sp.]|nr:DNA/RNA non-specific endonuclease [Prevotella sp.]